MMETPLTYKDAGVDIAEGNAFVEDIKPIAKKTRRDGVLNGIGGFGALFQLPIEKYKNPILVSSTDGVGTKLKLATQLNTHNTIGIDLVAMCVNDILVQGAEPLFFLDYFATSKLDRGIAKEVMLGIGKGCELANVALIGGETAEMPDMYQPSDYDLAGFTVGIVDRDSIIDGRKVIPGDKLLALGSSGAHSNGYSLIRKLLAKQKIDLNTELDQKPLGEILLTPTRIYVQALLSLFKAVDVHALAHITGGGLIENLPRVLPQFTNAVIDRNSWELPTLFGWLQQQGSLSDEEMLRTFNCGVGMVVFVAPHDVSKAIAVLEAEGENVWEIGHIAASTHSNPSIVLTNS